MATASISAKIKGDATDFKAALTESQTAANNWASRMAATRARVAQDFTSARGVGGAGGAGFLGGAFSMASISKVTAGLGAVAAAGYAANRALNWADNLRDIQDGLEMVGKDAEDVSLQLDHLLMLSKQPNVDFFQAAEASKKLRALGYTAEQTRTIILSLANALAATGEADESLLSAVEALSKIESKGEISERQLVSLMELAPKIREAFGSMGVETAQDLEKLGADVKQIVAALVTELQKIPATAADAGDKVRFEKGYAKYMAQLASMKVENLLVRPGDVDSPTAQRARAGRLTAPPVDQTAAEEKKQKAIRDSIALKQHESNVEQRKAALEKATAAEKDKAQAQAQERVGRIRTLDQDPDARNERRFNRSRALRKQYGTYDKYLQRDPEQGSMSMEPAWKKQFSGLDAFNRFKEDKDWGRVLPPAERERKAHQQRLEKEKGAESPELKAYKEATKAFEKAVEAMTPTGDKAKSEPVKRQD